MKKLTVIFIALCFLMGCAGTRQVSRGEFMNRAGEFDAKYQNQMQTEQYKTCYGKFFVYLLNNCKPLADEFVDTDQEWRYWTCADKALDGFVECMEDNSEKENVH